MPREIESGSDEGRRNGRVRYGKDRAVMQGVRRDEL
jgi:hypothetical protein